MLTGLKRATGLRPMSYGQTELIHTIRRCGLTSGLQLCLDAGDAASYSSGQSWLDTSGNGYDFFRGATSGAEASDPTFNGTAGRRSSGEYWSFDGGDYFRYDSANETWMNSLHKDNAKFTMMAWMYTGNIAVGSPVMCSAVNTTQVGILWQIGSSERSEFIACTGSGAALANTAPAGLAMPVSDWGCLALSLDEAVGANGGLWFMNGLISGFTSTYSSPSASNATNTMELGAKGAGVDPCENTTKLGMFAAWSGVALTQTQLNALYQTTRGRFGV